MGHETILVIGDNFLDQLGKFQRTEYADTLSKHVLSVEVLSKLKTHYESWPNKNESSLLDWAKRMFSIEVLAEGQEPDLAGKQKNGWIRLDVNGEISSIIDRKIPEGFFDWFEGTLSYWKLKPGAEGIDVNLTEEFSVVTGFAGSARKSLIELASMWEIIDRCAAERWDMVMAACRGQNWEAFDVIWEKYKAERFSHELHQAAYEKWAIQPAVKAIFDMPGPDEWQWEKLSQLEFRMTSLLWKNLSHYDIDRLHLPRDEYVKSYDLGHLLRYSEIIKDGVLLKASDERELFDSLADDTLLTIAYVHS